MVAITISTVIPALIMGFIIGALELYYLVKDEASGDVSTVLGHGVWAFVQVSVIVFFVMHREIFLELFPGVSGVPLLGWAVGNAVAFRFIMGAIEFILLEFKSRAFSGRAGGMAGGHEEYIHVFIIVILTVFSPEIWNLIATFLPWKF